MSSSEYPRDRSSKDLGTSAHQPVAQEGPCPAEPSPRVSEPPTAAPVEAPQEEADEFQALLLSTATSAFYVVDASRTIIRVNQAFCDVMGFTEREIVGQRCGTLGTPCGVGECPFIDSGSTTPTHKREETVVSKTGRRITVVMSATAFRSSDGVRAVIHSFLDITDLDESRKVSRDERDRARSALEEAHKAKVRLEKLLSLASEREIQMVKLKAEVNKLLEQQGAEPKYLAPKDVERLFGSRLAADV